MTYLTIEGTPYGAKVLINGKEEFGGLITPEKNLFIDSFVKNGKITLTISKSGYTTNTYILHPSGNKISLDYILQKVATPTPTPTPSPTPAPALTTKQANFKRWIDELNRMVAGRDDAGRLSLFRQLFRGEF